MNRLVLAVTLSILAATAAMAQDAQGYFDNFYAGIYAGSTVSHESETQGGLIVGGRLNVGESFLIGVEGRLGLGAFDGRLPVQEASGAVQAGIVISGNVLVYGTAGLGVSVVTYPGEEQLGDGTPQEDETVTNSLLLGGLGVEFAANEKIRLRGEVQAEMTFEELEEDYGALPDTRFAGAVLFAFD